MSNSYINDQTNPSYFPEPSKASYLGKQKPGSGCIGESGKNKGKSIGLSGKNGGSSVNMSTKKGGYEANNAS